MYRDLEKMAAYNKRWREANKEKVRAQKRASRLRNIEAARARDRAYYLANKDKRDAQSKAYHAAGDNRLRSRLKKYGLTPDTYRALLKSQKDKCAICKAKEPGGNRRWHVDHCHDTGKVRGLLCSQCNVGIGMLKHSPKILKAAISYCTPTRVRVYSLTRSTNYASVDSSTTQEAGS
jgi:hypothetical protein